MLTKQNKEIKKRFDINIVIGGAAGQGIQTIGVLLCKALFRAGYYVFALQDYQSRIKGGHNTFRVRVSNEPLSASIQKIDILVAMDAGTYRIHLPEVIQGGIIMYDAGKLSPPVHLEGLSGIPIEKLSLDAAKNKNLGNTVMFGAVIGMLEVDFIIVHTIIAEKFAKKGDEIIDNNTAAARAGQEYVKENYHRVRGIALAADTRFQKKQEMLKKSRNPRMDGKMLVNGTEAGGFGMISAGVNFYSAYPMTPSTGLLNYIAAHAKNNNILVEQAEDEIAALQMALGASYAGARAATGTSGGGFALMVEGVSLAGITETPIVVFVIQRPGPATGLPTRTEQSDLEFVIHAGHGEFPKFVFAPGDPAEMFTVTVDAFNLAEKYQVPVFILGDQYLGDSYRVLNMFDVGKVQRNTQVIVPDKEYKRYALSANGISPRALPGQGDGVVVVDSDEHDEYGHLTEDLNVRIQQADKRMKKVEFMKKEISGPTRYGDLNARTRIVCWGSTLGIGQEVVDVLRFKGANIELIHFSHIWPFPKESAAKALQGADRLIGLENNSQAQLCRIIMAETGIRIKERILKYNGMQFFPDEVIRKIHGNCS